MLTAILHEEERLGHALKCSTGGDSNLRSRRYGNFLRSLHVAGTRQRVQTPEGSLRRWGEKGRG